MMDEFNENEIDLGPRKKFAVGLAQKLLKEAAVIKAPVSIDQIVGHVQKTQELLVKSLGDVSERVSGLLVQCQDNEAEYAVIGYNEKHPWRRRRFTICHEIGHLLMGLYQVSSQAMSYKIMNSGLLTKHFR